MHRSFTPGAVLTLIAILSLSCSFQKGNPAVPDDLTSRPTAGLQSSQTHLWGLYDVCIDIPGQTATAKLERSAMFTANVVNFVNGMATGLTFKINKTPVGGDYVDVDIDVSITHPFPGLTQYNGYDVRGVFMGNGSAPMKYNSDLRRPDPAIDQFMLADPVDGIGGPDGFTRWFNRSEFSKGAMPLFSYTQGKMATPDYFGSATLCPYKYFANYLAKDEDLWTWMADPNPDNPTGVFSAGQSNTRNYYLRFPNSQGTKFSYAILASWKGTEASDHPANAPEAVAVSVVDDSTVYFVGPSENGGNLIFDVSLWDWDSTINPSGEMKDYKILVESTVLSGLYQASTPDMTPIDGDDHYSTYRFDIPADNVTGLDGNEFWVIAECAHEDYSNEFGEYNDAWADPLTAFFRFDLVVADHLLNTPPTITGITDDIAPDGLNTILHGSDTAVTYTAEYDDPDAGQTHTFKWYIENSSASSPSDPPDSMPFNWGPKTPGDYKIWVKVSDGFQEVTSDPYAVTRAVGGWQWTQTWGGNDTEGTSGYCVTADSSGNVYAAGSFWGTVDFNPGSGVDNHSSNGDMDCFLSKFNGAGEFQWARTWGGSQQDAITGVRCYESDVFVDGWYRTTVDFDPSGGTDSHTIVGVCDPFLSKFDSSGNYQWVKVWGGPSGDGCYGLAIDNSGNLYATGVFEVNIDLDPGAGTDLHYAVSWADAWVFKLDSSGIFQWGETWGGSTYDRGEYIAVDDSGIAYVVGRYGSSVDFNPGSGSDWHTAVGSWDVYLSKFDSSGNFQWVDCWGGTGEDIGFDVTLDGDGNPYVAGWFDGINVDFDPGSGTDYHSSAGYSECFMSKFDSAGTYAWAKTWGAANNEANYGVAVDDTGKVLATGLFEGTVDFDPGSGTENVGSNGSGDAFLSQFDSAGAFSDVWTWGGSGFDRSQAITTDNMGNWWVVGRFQSTVDFDPGTGVDNHSAVGSVDFFLSKFEL